MYMRYFGYILFSIFAASLIVSCQTPAADNKSEVLSVFNIISPDLTFGYEGGETELEFTAPGDWTISVVDDSWCKVSPLSGSGDAKVTVTVDELLDTEDARLTKLGVTCNGLTLLATVSQTTNPDAFVITPTSIELGFGEGDFSITVLSRTYAYDITMVDEWITEVSREGDPKTGETITFHVEANTPTENAAPRTGILSVCATDSEDGTCIPVTVRQAGLYDPQVLAFRFTATWCGYCPYMDEAFHKVAEQDSHFEYVTLHAIR